MLHTEKRAKTILPFVSNMAIPTSPLSISKNGVYKTAPATPSVLMIAYLILPWEHPKARTNSPNAQPERFNFNQ